MTHLLYALLLLGDPVKVGEGIQPQVAVDADGAVYVAWFKDGKVLVASSSDRAKTFGESVVAIDAGSAKAGKQRGPRIAVDAKKTLYVTMPMNGDIQLATSSDAGKTWSKPVRVNDAAGKAMEALHWIAAGPAGELHAAWIDCREGKGNDLFYGRVVDGKASANLKIADDVCNCCAPGVAADEKGNVTLLVREGGQKASREILMARSTDGGKNFSKTSRANKASTNIKG